MSSRTIAAAITVVALALVLAGGCGSAAEPREDDRAPPRSGEAGGAPAPRALPEPIASAVATAKAQGKRVLVDFYATWCPSCTTMLREVYPAPEVAALLDEGYVMLKVDVDEHRALARDMGVSSIPDARILDADGAELDRFVGEKPADEVAAILRRNRRD